MRGTLSGREMSLIRRHTEQEIEDQFKAKYATGGDWYVRRGPNNQLRADYVDEYFIFDWVGELLTWR